MTTSTVRCRLWIYCILFVPLVRVVHLQTTTVAPGSEFSVVPISCAGLRQELIKIPVLQEETGQFTYVYGCDEIRSGNCKFPGGSLTLKKPCSLQCYCTRTITGRYQIGDCYNTCRMPPVGQKCFVNGTSSDGCCPSYSSCIPNINAPFGTIQLDRPVPFPPYKSQRFRCIPGDTLPLEACLLFLKREALPKIKFAYGIYAICRCIAEDTFGFTVSVPNIPDIPVQRYLLLQRGTEILKQPINAIPYTPP
ncbi:uncharacterized protein LOC129584101 [Paramacrobiotus metropolitanus]|uniref:uncharacterized protein LOC129584101 n=1 Tax=Paramacrobiotus metropolitanus TaxID=2943436 RepID=UPI00244591F9|nr:uncharacterized protein LOC129584101 [Paramacrobiotus metropolitanus]